VSVCTSKEGELLAKCDSTNDRANELEGDKLVDRVAGSAKGKAEIKIKEDNNGKERR
jgi:hypothetical protein